MDKILAPFKIRAIHEEEFTAELSYEPLMRGFGHTVGNSLRRILLSSLRGARVIAIEGQHILHELTSLPGVLQDISEICFNLQSVRLYIPNDGTYTLKLNVSGPQTVRASAITEHSGIKILTPNAFLFQMDGSHDVSIDIIVESNVGIRTREELISYNKDIIGRVYLHDKYYFSPVISVGIQVEEYIMGRYQHTFNRLKLIVKTDGSIKPVDAVTMAAHNLQNILSVFIKGDIIYENTVREKEIGVDIDNRLFTKIVDLNLSTRAENSLVNAGIKYMGDLLSRDPSKIQSKITNFGQKSFDEVCARIEELGLQWTGVVLNWPSSAEEVERLYIEYNRNQKYDSNRRL